MTLYLMKYFSQLLVNNEKFFGTTFGKQHSHSEQHSQTYKKMTFSLSNHGFKKKMKKCAGDIYLSFKKNLGSRPKNLPTASEKCSKAQN